MTDLVVRRLLVDMEAPIARHWCGGDAFRTALFNALSMSFPVGEQFFIDSVRNGFKALPPEQAGALSRRGPGLRRPGSDAPPPACAVQRAPGKAGPGQRLGAARARQRLKLLEGVDPRHALAITAANEHFTAIMADWMLRNPDLLGSARPAADDLVAVAQRRGVGAQEHGLRPVPGAGRQPRMAHHLVSPRHHDLPGRHAAPDREQPAARRHACGSGAPGRAPPSYLFGKRGLRAA